ncbi:MAG: hypothetical protein WC479_04280 [Candidatus Izemoplasmatales bacterium]|jgi:hypothetical protein|nr:hypothetical protein [Candidatus Izemoplasmatales bacterium]MDD3865078.1 hypothetical protein [Candidatus Izemoplasmatales bacterium]
MITKTNIMALFMERQHFINKANPKSYAKIFRMMSPVSTLYWTRPGDPPLLAHRASFNDLQDNDKKRSRREIVKGRFQKGGVGYIYADEWELYAGLYRVDLGKITKQEYEILNLLEHEGSMNIHELKAVTGLYVKDLTPILHRLQQAFKIFEDQRDREWDRNWYAFENEYPEVDIKHYSRIEALKIVLLRFAYMHVSFSLEMAKSFYQLAKAEISQAIEELIEEDMVVAIELNNAKEYMSKVDYEYLTSHNLLDMPPSVIMLHRSDFLVKSRELELKNRFKDKDHGLLYYLLIDGEFKGALFGRFTFGPTELKVLKLNLPADEIDKRKTEIYDAIYQDDLNPLDNPLLNVIQNQ